MNPRKKPVPAGGEEGSKTRVDCALNNLYNLEKVTRSARCNFYQNFGHKESVRVGFWCRGARLACTPSASTVTMKCSMVCTWKTGTRYYNYKLEQEEAAHSKRNLKAGGNVSVVQGPL